MHRLLTLLIGFQIVATSAFAHVLILNTSDMHSHYGRMGLWIQSMSKVSQEFMSQHPDGTVILVINGDFSGLSNWTDFEPEDGVSSDHGKLGYDVLAQLANYMEVVIIPGNHDQFDWSDEEGSLGHRLFVDHHRELLVHLEALKNRPAHLLAANVVPGKAAQDLFAPYADIPLKSGGSLRMIGLVLNLFYDRSNYQRDSQIDVIQNVRKVGPEILQQLGLAARDGREKVVVAIHDSQEAAQELAHAVDELQSMSGPALNLPPGALPVGKVKVPLWLGGHDHEPQYEVSNRRHFMQCGSNGDFCAIVLDDDHNVTEVKTYGESKQIALVGPGVHLRPFEQVALGQVNRRLEELEPALAQQEVVLGQTGGYDTIKVDLKKGRQTLGDYLADSLKMYAETQVSPKEKLDGVIAFYNSSSYRLDIPLPAGPVTVRFIRSIYPFLGTVGLFRRTGEQITAMFKELRRYRAAEKDTYYSPQLPSILREVDGFGLEIRNADGEWSPILPHGRYLLALDPWLSNNKYDLPRVWEQIGIEHKQANRDRPQHPKMRTVLIDYLPGLLNNCPSLLVESGMAGRPETRKAIESIDGPPRRLNRDENGGRLERIQNSAD